ncbi:MAG: TonB-dependent receptor [Bacteroidia bacterium]|nr:TonB-dependent receptor [Bacteroidia bacterium]
MKRLFLLVVVGVLSLGFIYAQRTVTGTVTDETTSQPLEGVAVVVKGTSIGIFTDAEGKYRLVVPDNGDVLVFSLISHARQEIEIAGRNVIDVVMSVTALQVDEVVVIGYGTLQRKSLTGALSSVKGEDISAFPAPSFDQMLAGRAAGLQVTTNSGVLGEAPRIRIRGTNTISSGADPLIVIDNVPVVTGDQSGAAAQNVLADINPNDIESVEVLKDGSATAIFGSRAANGVILITTKRGKLGEGARVSYDANIGVNTAASRLDLLNAEEFIEIANEKFRNAGQPDQAFPGPGNVDTDWQDLIFRNGVTQTHNLSISGGSERTSYFFSTGFSDQQGALIANNLKRYSFRGNVDHSLNRAIKIGTSLSLTRSITEGLNTGSNALSGNLVGAARLLPNVRALDPENTAFDGYNITPDGAALGQDNNLRPVDNNFTNQSFVLANNQFRAANLRVLGNAYGELKIIDGLKLRSQIGVDMLNNEGFLSWDPRHGDGRGANGVLFQQFVFVSLWNWQNTLNFNKIFADAHDVNFVAGYEAQQRVDRNFDAQGSNFSDLFFLQENLIDGSYGNQFSGGDATHNGFDSYFARVNYGFKGKYLIGASFRNDGISSLAEPNRRANFFGASAGYRISEESFFKNSGISKIISELKLRGSFAQVGNVDIGNFPYVGSFGAAQYGDLTGIAFSQAGNADLQWESATNINVGVDFGFLNDRLGLVVNWFNNDVDNLVLARPTPPSVGVPGNSINQNVGAIKNSGIEVELNALTVTKGGFSWSTAFNFAYIKNEVVALNNDEDIIFTYHINRVGESIGTFYGFEWYGVNQANGNPIWVKADGSLVQYNVSTGQYRVYTEENPEDVSTAGTLSAATDRKLLGNSNPLWQGGWNNTFSYKGLSLQIFFRYVGGNYIMNVTRQATLLNMGFQNNGREILERWTEAGQQTNVPKLYAGREAAINNTGAADSRFIEPGDFVRLQNATLSYELPKSLLGNISSTGIRSARLFVQGQNLLTFSQYSGLDPELNSVLNTNSQFGLDNNTNPLVRTLSGGISLGF